MWNNVARGVYCLWYCIPECAQKHNNPLSAGGETPGIGNYRLSGTAKTVPQPGAVLPMHGPVPPSVVVP